MKEYKLPEWEALKAMNKLENLDRVFIILVTMAIILILIKFL